MFDLQRDCIVILCQCICHTPKYTCTQQNENWRVFEKWRMKWKFIEDD